MIGSHLSIAGGMTNALLAAEALGLDTVQVFTKNQQQWAAKPLDPAAADDWLVELDRLGWRGRVVSHASYLINLASPDDTLWHKSIALMTDEIERCERLAVPFLVHHPGASTGSSVDEALARIAAAYQRLFRDTPGYTTVCCLENTVGSGTNLGREFAQLARIRSAILDASPHPERVGYCFDTCHAHAGGHDMASLQAARSTLDAFDHACGLANLRVVHVNDSLAPLGSRKDRHAHIGLGTIGRPPGLPEGAPSPPLARTGFAEVMNRPELAGLPKILETPKGTDDLGREHDAVNLEKLRSLIGSGPHIHHLPTPDRKPGRTTRR